MQECTTTRFPLACGYLPAALSAAAGPTTTSRSQTSIISSPHSLWLPSKATPIPRVAERALYVSHTAYGRIHRQVRVPKDVHCTYSTQAQAQVNSDSATGTQPSIDDASASRVKRIEGQYVTDYFSSPPACPFLSQMSRWARTAGSAMPYMMIELAAAHHLPHVVIAIRIRSKHTRFVCWCVYELSFCFIRSVPREKGDLVSVRKRLCFFRTRCTAPAVE